MVQFNMLIIIIFINFVFIIIASAQNSAPSKDVVANFQPSLAVVIGILAIMFSLTFLLLLYAKFCHRASAFNHNGITRIRLIRSRSQSSGIDKTVVESLPFFRFSSLRGSREGLECAVCLSRFEDIEILRLLPKCKHAFHINCIDQWLEKHSSCPLCRQRVSADDDSSFHEYSNSLRIPWNHSEAREESNLELYVEREEENLRGSSRFSVGRSFRRTEKASPEDEVPIQPDEGDGRDLGDERKALHKLNHRIVVSDVMVKNRWSNVSSSDLMFLSSEMLGEASSGRFFAPPDLSSGRKELPAGDAKEMNIKEEMERKRIFETKFNKIKENDSVPFPNLPPTSSNTRSIAGNTSRTSNFPGKRSMSEITTKPRFFDSNNINNRDSSVQGNTAKEERTRRIWLPIARRTVRWFAHRESTNTRGSMNV